VGPLGPGPLALGPLGPAGGWGPAGTPLLVPAGPPGAPAAPPSATIASQPPTAAQLRCFHICNKNGWMSVLCEHHHGPHYISIYFGAVEMMCEIVFPGRAVHRPSERPCKSSTRRTHLKAAKSYKQSAYTERVIFRHISLNQTLTYIIVGGRPSHMFLGRYHGLQKHSRIFPINYTISRRIKFQGSMKANMIDSINILI